MGYRKVLQLLGGAVIMSVTSAMLLVEVLITWSKAPILAASYSAVALLSAITCAVCVDITRYNPADSHTWYTLLTQYLFAIIDVYTAGPTARAFRKRLQLYIRTQEDTLQWIIKRNMDTAYGRDHDLSSISYRKYLHATQPLTDYDHYSNYIERVYKGEKDIMTTAQPEMIGISSGTKNKPNKYPYSMVHNNRVNEAFRVLRYNSFHKTHSMALQRWFQFRFPCLVRKNAHGLREGDAKSVIYKPHSFNIIPKSVHYITDEEANFYVQAVLAAADKEIGKLEGYSSDLWLSFFKFMVTSIGRICDAIEKGQLDQYPGLPEDVKQELNNHLKAQPVRAREVRAILSGPADGLALRLWPTLSEVEIMTSGRFAHAARLLKISYLSGIPMGFPLHAGTKGHYGMVYEPPVHEEIYTCLVNTVYLEFIPEECIEENNPKTLFIEQIYVGECYEIVVTNCNGLYRFRTGDVIQVVDFAENTPKYKFMYRKDQVLNIASERTTEKMLQDALWSVVEKLPDLSVMRFTSVESLYLEPIGGDLPSPAHYIIFMETSVNDGPRNTDVVQHQLDDVLREINEGYDNLRKTGVAGPLVVLKVSPGSFNGMIRSFDKGETPPVHHVPTVLRKHEALRFLWKRRIQTFESNVQSH